MLQKISIPDDELISGAITAPGCTTYDDQSQSLQPYSTCSGEQSHLLVDRMLNLPKDRTDGPVGR